MHDGRDARAGPSATELTATVAAFFAPGGRLATALPGYEPRPEQAQVAAAVAAAMADGAPLLAEAGTGCGKSLAYLVPALCSGLRVVVSTGTKNLQDQLLRHEVPLLRRLLRRPLRVEVIKGRGNYLCERRAALAMAQGLLPHLPQAALLARVRDWRHSTQTGDRAELADLPDASPLWREVSASGEQCSGRACRDYERCWVTEARRRAGQAALIVANHHLYLADAALRREAPGEHTGLLPPHDVVIFDEAHELADIAGQHFGAQVSERRIAELAHDIAAAAAGRPTLAARVAAPAEKLGAAATALFAALALPPGRSPLPDAPLDAATAAAHATLDETLAQLEATLCGHDDDALAHLGRRAAQLAAELCFVLRQLPRPGLGRQVTLPDESATPYVRFAEAQGRARALLARPVDVAPLLGPLFARRATVFVSATLRNNRSFGHFRRSVGLGAMAELAVPSPFDYAAQTRLYLPDDLPEPDAPGHAAAIAARVAALVEAAGGGAFVLCTSHRALAAMAAAARAGGAHCVLTQGEAPKAALLARFRAVTDAVLVGTQSFWKGVDVPGPSLRLVIIDRIPFASPGDPLVAARLAWLSAQGEDPFMAHQVPQAAQLLSQGFGRLIRRHDDRGVVAVLDRRLLSRRYGPLLLRNLPRCPRLTALDAATAALRAWRPAPE